MRKFRLVMLGLFICLLSVDCIATEDRELSESEALKYCRLMPRHCEEIKEDQKRGRVFSIIERYKTSRWLFEDISDLPAKLHNAGPVLEKLGYLTELLSDKYGIPISLGSLHSEHMYLWRTVAFGQLAELEKALESLSDTQVTILKELDIKLNLFTNSAFVMPAKTDESNTIHIDNFGFSIFPMTREVLSLLKDGYGKRMNTITHADPAAMIYAPWGVMAVLALSAVDVVVMTVPQSTVYLIKRGNDAVAGRINDLASTEVMRADQAEAHTMRMRQISQVVLREILVSAIDESGES